MPHFKSHKKALRFSLIFLSSLKFNADNLEVILLSGVREVKEGGGIGIPGLLEISKHGLFMRK